MSPRWHLYECADLIRLLGSRVRMRSLALTRPDTEAEGYYLNPSSQMSKLVSPMFTMLKSTSHKQNGAAASQRNRPLPTISSLPFWKVRAESFRYHFIFLRNCLFSEFSVVSTELPICYLFKGQSKQRFSLDIFVTPKFKERRYSWFLIARQLLVIPKIKNKSAVRLIRGSFLSGNTGLAISQAKGC